MSSSDSVTVALRVRPLVRSETERGCQLAIQRAPDGAPQVTINRTDSFTYNYVFDSGDSQQMLYEACVLPKIKKLLRGFNVTILAYGQTGSGKTYTMGTAFSGAADEHVGVIPRAVLNIFQDIAALQTEFDFTVKCSFVELYQEQFFDLLSPNGRVESTVDIREDKNGIIMPGLTEIIVKSAQEVTDQLVRGSSGRAVASTAMNEQSSRSHAIFTITIVAGKKNDKKSVTTSRFNLVDLAGSERCSKTQATGDRFKEGVNINKGLLALGNVINALGTAQNVGYVPYRQSKLTRLLQDSLGGNSITLMIACVSPADYNVPETLSTLRYADRALQIKNKPIINLDPHAAEINQLKDIIQKLRVELLAGGGQMSSSLITSMGGAGLPAAAPAASSVDQQRLSEQLKTLQEANDKLEKRNRKLQEELHRSLVDLAEHGMRVHIAEITHDKLKGRIEKMKEIIKASGLDTTAAGEPGEDSTAFQRQQQLRELSLLVDSIAEEQQRSDCEQQEQRDQFFRNGNGSHHNHSMEDHNEAGEEMQSQAEAYTNKQLNLNEELREINRELDLKQMLHQRVCTNFNKMYALEDGIEQKYKDSECKIQELETERRDLLEKLRHIKQTDTSAKLAEERRKRLQTLEQDIVEMRRKILQQSKMLKIREKENEKIQNLSSEIRSMKESKVKLIRSMRSESEKFRQWKLQREKELTQLKSKDRKMQSEMAKKDALHTKQRTVLKRKCEEALAINKRLKDALERQSAAQRQRHAKDHTAIKTDAWVDRELEVILSLIDAEHSLEQLMEDRAVINARMIELKEQPTATEELQSLEEELEMRNAQIADLQQKVCVSDLESRMRTLSEGVQTVNESRVVNKHLIKAMVQQRREQAQGTLEQTQRMVEQKLSLEEQRAQLREADERLDSLNKRLRLAENKHKELMAEQQRSYEEKVSVLLRAAHPQEDSERQQVIEEYVCRMEALKEEMEQMKEQQAAKSKKKQQRNNVAMPQIIKHDIEESFCEVVPDDDPDWLPKFQKRRGGPRKTHSVDGTQSPPYSEQANFSNTSDITDATVASSTGDRSSTAGKAKGCKCRNKCDSKRCGCFTGGKVCSDSCVCKAKCRNPLHKQQHGGSDGDSSSPDKENQSASTKTLNESAPEAETEKGNDNEAVAIKHETPPVQLLTIGAAAAIKRENDGNCSTPKLARMSALDFNTPSTKQKFFK